MRELIKSRIGDAWDEHLGEFLVSATMHSVWGTLQQLVREGKQVYPRAENVFKAFKMTPWDKVRVVILGQDPYYTTTQHFTSGEIFPMATGLAFGINDDSLDVPPSLKNIQKEVERTSEEKFMMTDLSLENWAKQGVFLFNTALTVQAGQPESHTRMWEPFTAKVLEALNKREDRIIYLLWGKKAQAFEEHIAPHHLILKTSHPSPLSSHRGFDGCGHFAMVNEQLDPKISWI